MRRIYAGPERHIVPRDDLIAHDDDAECVCGPDELGPATMPGRDGVRWTVVHHALDGRPRLV